MTSERQDNCCSAAAPVWTANRWHRQGYELPQSERRLLRCILQHFIEYGAAPDTVALTSMAQEAGLALAPALASLTAHDLLITDPETRAIAGAYPFSAVPTPHQVVITGAATVFAMCALDALGIAFLAGRNAKVLSRDAATGKPLRITVDVQSGTATAEQAGIVLFAPSAGYEGSAATCICPVIAFFGSAASAEDFAAAHPDRQGRVIPLEEAVVAGRRTFEDPGDFFPAV